MKDITKEMIKIFKINKLGYDMMGYEFKNRNELSYHHLIIPKRNGGKMTFENGAILCQDTSHNYLHCLENLDYDRFLYITSELIDINISRMILYENLLRINDCLSSFEREYVDKRNKKGKLIIKEEYTRRLIKDGKIRR